MGKKYYCDYCDKSFADNATSRKNHLRGVTHQRLRKAHYEASREPSVILAEELSKAPCREFKNTGYCKFGNACRYSHMTEEEKKSLQAAVEAKRTIRAKKQEPPTLDSWLSKHPELLQNTSTAETAVSSETSALRRLPEFTLPPECSGRTDLPPSLIPPPPDAFHDLTISEWG